MIMLCKGKISQEWTCSNKISKAIELDHTNKNWGMHIN